MRIPSGVIIPVNWNVLSKTALSFSPLSMSASPARFCSVISRMVPMLAGAPSVLDEPGIKRNKNPGNSVAFQQPALIVFRHGLATLPGNAPVEYPVPVFRCDELAEIVHNEILRDATENPGESRVDILGSAGLV